MIRRRPIVALLAVAVALLAHELVARALVDHGVAGALFSRGAAWTSLAAAVGFVTARVAGLFVLAALPTLVLVRWSSAVRPPPARTSATPPASGPPPEPGE